MQTSKKFDSAGLFDSQARLISSIVATSTDEQQLSTFSLPQPIEDGGSNNLHSGDSVAPKIPTVIGQSTPQVVPAVDLAAVTNADFINSVFGNIPNGLSALVCSKYGDPTSGAWSPKSANQVHGLAANTNNYVNCASFKPDPDRTFHARKGNAVAYHCLVLDDVGTKVAREGLGSFNPTWAIETSPGNSQVGISLTNPLTGAEEVAQLQDAVIAAGLCDPGANGMARWVRLPVGINGKEKYIDTGGKKFQCRLTEWNPEVSYTVDQIVAGLKLDMQPVKVSVQRVVKDVCESNVDTAAPVRTINPADVEKLAQLLAVIDPDCRRQDWLHVLMAVYHTTGGSDAGFELIDAWSSKGKKYQGVKEMEIQWHSFSGEVQRPVTIGSLIMMAKAAGADVGTIMQNGAEAFEPCETEVVYPTSGTLGKLPHSVVTVNEKSLENCKPEAVQLGAQANSTTTAPDPHIVNPLTRFSLRDSLVELEKQKVAQKLILGDIVLLGQATVIYALANTGKTLILIHLILEGIKKGLIDPSQLYYINMDDNSSGLVDKVRLFSEYGGNMLADGHKGFAAKKFRVAMVEMTETDTARGVIVVLDTLKKFVNAMSKDESREFAGLVRRFCLKGGTVIALHHANKNPGADGKIKYSGTTDIIDDVDCGYTLQTVSEQPDTNKKVVEFTNIKRRGDVALTASYSYALERGLSYSELLLSVAEVDLNQLEPIKQAAELKTDATIISAIEASITAGITTKMKMVDAASKGVGVSNRIALTVIEKYTGNDPSIHRWMFVVRARGAHVYELLAQIQVLTVDANLSTP